MSRARPDGTTRSAIEKLPRELQDLIIKQLPDSDKSCFVTTCKTFYAFGLFAVPLSAENEHLQTESAKVKELLKLIDAHDFASIMPMLNADPGMLLLSYKGEFPLQRAYKNRDYVMCRYLKNGIRHLRQGIDDGDQFIREQLNPEFIASLGDPNETYHLKSIVATRFGILDSETQLTQFRKNIDAIVADRGFPFEAFAHALDTQKSIRFNLLMSYDFCIEFNKKIIGYYQKKAPRWLQNIFLKDTCRNDSEIFDAFILDEINKLNAGKGYTLDPEQEADFKKRFSDLGFRNCISVQGHFSHYWGLSYRTPWLLEGDIAKYRQLFKRVEEELAALFPHIAEQAHAIESPAKKM